MYILLTRSLGLDIKEYVGWNDIECGGHPSRRRIHIMNTGTILLIIVGVVLLWLLIDLLLAGGAMTGGMMGGMMMMIGNPIGATVLLVLLGAGALFAYITFFT